MKDSDFKRLDMNKLSQPPKKSGLYHIIKNTYWLLDKNGCGLIYKGYSRQCNTIKEIGDRMVTSKNHPGVENKFFETIYLPAD